MPTLPGRRPARSPLRVEPLEDRTVPAFGLSGGESIAIGDVFPEVNGSVQNEIVVGAGPGSPPTVRVFSAGGTLEAEFLAYEPTFLGGVHVAVANLSGTATAGRTGMAIITGPGVGGGPLVKVFDPSNSFRQQFGFLAYESTFRGGVNVAGGNVDPTTPTGEIVTGSGPGGGPVVKTFTADGRVLRSFFAYEPTFRFGVNVAAGPVLSAGSSSTTGDDIVTGPGLGGSPLAKVFDSTGALRKFFFAFDQGNRNGLTVAVGDTENSLAAEVFAAEDFSPTANPEVRSFDAAFAGQIESDFFPYPAGFTHAINFAIGDVFNTGVNNAGDFAAVPGEGPTSQTPRIFFGSTGSAAGNNGPP